MHSKITSANIVRNSFGEINKERMILFSTTNNLNQSTETSSHLFNRGNTTNPSQPWVLCFNPHSVVAAGKFSARERKNTIRITEIEQRTSHEEFCSAPVSSVGRKTKWSYLEEVKRPKIPPNEQPPEKAGSVLEGFGAEEGASWRLGTRKTKSSKEGQRRRDPDGYATAMTENWGEAEEGINKGDMRGEAKGSETEWSLCVGAVSSVRPGSRLDQLQLSLTCFARTCSIANFQSWLSYVID